MSKVDKLGTDSVRKLVFMLGWPAALNFVVATAHNLADVIYVGNWLGPLQIAAVVVVGTISFIFSAFGLGLGGAGGSIISRALGSNDKERANHSFGNQVLLIAIIGLLIVSAGWIFESAILKLFGAKGDIFGYASSYYRIILFSVPLLSFSMMSNNIIHTEGKAKVAMWFNVTPTALNIILNPIFLKVFNMGIEGVAWATFISISVGFLLPLFYFITGRSVVKMGRKYLKFQKDILLELGHIGGAILANIVAMNLFVIVLNQVLFKYYQESGVVIYGIVSRLNMIFIIILAGVEGGIRPVIGFNYGSQQIDRVKKAVEVGLKYGGILCCILLVGVLLMGNYLVLLFTSDENIIVETTYAMRIVFALFPLNVLQIVNTAYFQTIGKPNTALYLTLTKNVALTIPLLFILPLYFGYNGVLYTFPIVEILITIPSIWVLHRELNYNLTKRLEVSVSEV